MNERRHAGERRSGDAQLRAILDGAVADVRQVELPHWRGTERLLHLMSVVSLVSDDLAVVYAPLVPIRVMELLHERGFRFVGVPDEEYDTLAPNVLALAPNRVLLCAGNPATSARLRDAGVDVLEYQGDEISIRWESGPTCNTRPILRD